MLLGPLTVEKESKETDYKKVNLRTKTSNEELILKKRDLQAAHLKTWHMRKRPSTGLLSIADSTEVHMITRIIKWTPLRDKVLVLMVIVSSISRQQPESQPSLPEYLS